MKSQCRNFMFICDISKKYAPKLSSCTCKGHNSHSHKLLVKAYKCISPYWLYRTTHCKWTMRSWCDIKVSCHYWPLLGTDISHPPFWSWSHFCPHEANCWFALVDRCECFDMEMYHKIITGLVAVDPQSFSLHQSDTCNTRRGDIPTFIYTTTHSAFLFNIASSGKL